MRGSDLDREFGIPDHLEFEASALGGDIAVMAWNGAQASVAIYGGQVLHWQPPRNESALWLSPMARLGTGTPVRGGIPVCWPWFGPSLPDLAVDGAPWPQHGFARTSNWQVLGSSSGEAGTRLRLGFTSNQSPFGKTWPHAARATLEIVLAEALELTLTTHNTGTGPFTLTEALHAYFRVGDIGDVKLERLDGHAFHDAVALGPALAPSPTLRSQSGAVEFPGEVNRIYAEQSGAVSLVDRRLGRRIEIASTGSVSTVVWNPGPEKGAQLDDVGPDGWRRFLCVETANTVYDPILLAPGAAHTLTARYRVERI